MTLHYSTHQEPTLPLGTLFEAHKVLAYERGITDGGREYLSINTVNKRTKEWPGWSMGFALGIKWRRQKEVESNHNRKKVTA